MFANILDKHMFTHAYPYTIKIGGVHMEYYRNLIIQMVKKIHNIDFLIRIYSFVKVKYDKENPSSDDE